MVIDSLSHDCGEAGVVKVLCAMFLLLSLSWSQVYQVPPVLGSGGTHRTGEWGAMVEHYGALW